MEKLESASEKNLERPGKTLVVFNNRPNDTHLTHFTYELWHEKKANLTYSNDPNIITFDLNPAENSGHHIVGNASEFNTAQIPPDVGELATLVFERPPTFSRIPNDNIIVPQLRNFLPKLRSGGEVIIEWHPETAINVYYKATGQLNMPGTTPESEREKNIFTGFFDTNVQIHATLSALKSKYINLPSPDSIAKKAGELSGYVSDLLDYYATHQQSATRQDLEDRLLREIIILNNIPQGALANLELALGPHVAIREFNEKVDRCIITDINTRKPIEIMLTEGNQIKKPNDYWRGLSPTFRNQSFFYYLWSDVAVYVNARQVAEQLEKEFDLQFVHVHRGKNRVNNRENVWLIRGIKK